jgi:hypothetical protein
MHKKTKIVEENIDIPVTKVEKKIEKKLDLEVNLFFKYYNYRRYAKRILV